jgi:transcriptional regulator with XRE-family HTH domain
VQIKGERGKNTMGSKNVVNDSVAEGDDLARRIGKNLRELRKGMHLTLASLAEKTGLSSALFSRMENGEVMPSIGTLKTISDVLKVDIELFFRKDENLGYAISHPGARPMVKSKKGPYVTEVLAAGMENPFMEPFISYLAGKDKEEQIIPAQHEGQEFCYVLEGRIELMLGEKRFVLKKGDAAYWNGSIPHMALSLNKEGAKSLNVHLIPGKRAPEV